MEDDALAAALLRNVGSLANKTFGGVQATALVVPNAWEESQIATLARAGAAGLDEVYPERGALLVFPHRQPHAGRPTCASDPPKLIARGELLFVDE